MVIPFEVAGIYHRSVEKISHEGEDIYIVFCFYTSFLALLRFGRLAHEFSAMPIKGWATSKTHGAPLIVLG